jgi:hypothetical protein
VWKLQREQLKKKRKKMFFQKRSLKISKVFIFHSRNFVVSESSVRRVFCCCWNARNLRSLRLLRRWRVSGHDRRRSRRCRRRRMRIIIGSHLKRRSKNLRRRSSSSSAVHGRRRHHRKRSRRVILLLLLLLLVYHHGLLKLLLLLLLHQHLVVRCQLLLILLLHQRLLIRQVGIDSWLRGRHCHLNFDVRSRRVARVSCNENWSRLGLFRFLACSRNRINPSILIIHVMSPQRFVGAVGQNVNAKRLAHLFPQRLHLGAIVENNLIRWLLSLGKRLIRFPQQELHPLQNTKPSINVLLCRRIIPKSVRKLNRVQKQTENVKANQKKNEEKKKKKKKK